MKSLPPADYESMPALSAPAAYILVIRDVDGDRYRIDATQQPKTYLDELRGEGDRRYGFELIAVVETADIAASEAELYDRHLATLSGAWLHLDSHQLRELRESMLETGAFRSRYISPRPIKPAASTSRELRTDTQLPGGESPRGRPRERPTPPSSPVFVRYGSRALDGQRRLMAQSDAEFDSRPVPISQALSHFIDDLWTRHPGKLVAFVVVIAIVCLLSLDGSPYPPSLNSVTATAPPIVQDPTPTPAWRMRRWEYVVERSADVRSCPSIQCEYLGLLPVRTEIYSLAEVDGEEIDGNKTWIKFRYYDGEAYAHSSRLRISDA